MNKDSSAKRLKKKKSYFSRQTNQKSPIALSFKIEGSDDAEQNSSFGQFGSDMSSDNSQKSDHPENLLVPHSLQFPKEIVLLPVKEKPLFPGMFVPLVFPSDPFELIFKDIIEKHSHYLGMALERNPEDEANSSRIIKSDDKEFYRIGVLGKVVNVLSTNQNRLQAIISFTSRFKIEDIKKKREMYIARIKPLEEMKEEDLGSREKRDTLKGYAAALMSKVKELIDVNSVFSEELKNLASRYSSQSLQHFLNVLSSLLTVPKPAEAQLLLEKNDLTDKVLTILDYLHREVEVFKVKEKINQQIEEKVSGQQRDYFLKEQLNYIKKELGIDSDEKSLTITKIAEKIQNLPLSEEAHKAASSELEKLKVYDSKSPEFGVVKNYLDWILSLPWPKNNGILIPDLEKARKILDRHHYGLEKIKKQLLEFLAVEKLRKRNSGTILCFAGPPGVGKTSMGRSLAEAMGRKFYRFSVGGMRDEAEIKGHRRTYVGAMPGKIIQALKLTGTHNPVILIDEVDKLAIGFQGDPAAALLEVLDPEQNRDFLDHYLDIRFDLSKVVFITTANQLENIPPALRDRMEIIHLSSYVAEEKSNIAKKYLIPRQREANGLSAQDFSFSKPALNELIESYTAEAGVRGLERVIRQLLRKVAYLKANSLGANSPADFQKVDITPLFIEENLDEAKAKDTLIHTKTIPGVVCGLAWTPLGGSILYIEAIVAAEQENPGFKLTGQLGGVMEESAQLAYNYVRSLASENPIFLKHKKDSEKKKRDFFSQRLVHLHVPAGATPKDGPSAGISMALALSSLALGKGIRPDFAMTGELTLSGRVLPIGGLKEKLIAAKKNRKNKVIIPRDNRMDVKKINSLYLKGLTLFFVDNFSEVLDITLGFQIKK